MSDALFRQKAPGIMRKLMADFGLDEIEAAAIVGNLGHESGGFKFLQELKPMVPGSAGGYGWAQWTGARRREFEAYCRRNNLDPASDLANYGWLFVELSGPEKAGVAAVKRPGDLRGKVIAFEKAFERSGIPHYDGRVVWAQTALAAYRALPQPAEAPPARLPPAPPPRLPPDVETPVRPPVVTGKAGTVGGIITMLAAVLAALWALAKARGWL